MQKPSQTPAEALEDTNRSLRRLLRHLKDMELGSADELEKEIRRARRQVRANQELLGDR